MEFSKGKRYNDYTTFIKTNFENRVQKISLNAGFTCPNLDGSKGKGGCTYCNNNTFNPKYCKPVTPIKVQLDEGIAFFSQKYKAQQYLAYFQAFTNTYAETSILEELYKEALSHPKVIGMVTSTVKVKEIKGVSLLVIQPVNGQYKEVGSAIVAADNYGAGVGEYVLSRSS